MRIATFNVNGVNGRLPVLLRWLAETEPDIVCLQELKAAQDKFPARALQQAGYGAIWHGRKSWNGVAICRILDLIRRTASARVALRVLRMMAWGSSVPSSPALRAPLCGFGA